MLSVLTPDEVYSLIEREITEIKGPPVYKGLDEACGCVLAEDIYASEYVPDFNRSTVDGYALRASDTFGCSDSVPAILPLCGEVLMGERADFSLPEGTCCYVPTGGAIPAEADCAVMLEYAEDYGDGTVGIMKPAAPGANMIYRGDDVYPRKLVLKKGRRLTPADIGALAAIGVTSAPVKSPVKVGIISTGDELVPSDSVPKSGQVRDVNSPMLTALYMQTGAEVISYGIVRDEKALLASMVDRAVSECDFIVLSGGSSVGVKDAACEIIEYFGRLLYHGIAIKPGKPTIMGVCRDKPVICLPGHPVAAYYVAKLFTLPLLGRLTGETATPERTVRRRLSESIGANHGRSQINTVTVDGDLAYPVRSKSGLITSLAGTDGYIIIGRDCEGLEKDSEIEVRT